MPQADRHTGIRACCAAGRASKVWVPLNTCTLCFLYSNFCPTTRFWPISYSVQCFQVYSTKGHKLKSSHLTTAEGDFFFFEEAWKLFFTRSKKVLVPQTLSYLILNVVSASSSLVFPSSLSSRSHHTVAANMKRNNLSKIFNFTEVRGD